MKKTLLICLFLPLLACMSCGDNDADFDIPNLNNDNSIVMKIETDGVYDIHLAIQGARFAINWGDGNVIKYSSPDEMTSYTHKYRAPGSYKIMIWSDEITSFLLQRVLYNLKELTLGDCPNMKVLNIEGAEEVKLFESKRFPNLTFLSLGNIENLNVVEIVECSKLKIFQCYSNPELTTLDLSPDSELEKLVIVSSNFDAAELNRIFTNLPTGKADSEVLCYGNPGTETCDVSIAENKGWTVYLTPKP